MSKEKLLEALDHVRGGRIESAVACLREIHDVGFIRKRFAHYKTQPDHREAALRLEAALTPPTYDLEAGRAAADRPEFVAPLLPADVGSAPDRYITFDQPEPFLEWCSGDWDRIPELALQELVYTDVWVLVALGALCVNGRTRRPPVRFGGDSTAVRFAHALGLDALAAGKRPAPAEPLRTVALTSLRTREEIEPLADRMAKMVIENADAPDVRLAVRYVLVELLRNVVQHSGDPFGAVTAAQRMNSRQQRRRPMIQLAVAAAGVGIPRALQKAHPGLVDYRQALERALLPHISGTFDEGLTGSFENAGLGLFVKASASWRRMRLGGEACAASAPSRQALGLSDARDRRPPRPASAHAHTVSERRAPSIRASGGGGLSEKRERNRQGTPLAARPPLALAG